MTDAVVVLITAGSNSEAETIAKTLVDEHLVACVNIVPGAQSLFFWDGATRDAREALLVCKSVRTRMDRIIERVRSLHSYTVPEIIALPVCAGFNAYLEWIEQSTRE